MPLLAWHIYLNSNQLNTLRVKVTQKVRQETLFLHVKLSFL